MGVWEIYKKTLNFVWLKLGLGAVTFLASLVLLGVCTGMGFLFRNEVVILIMFLVWIAGTKLIHSIVMHYFGYLIKAGHIAVVTTAIKDGVVPDNAFEVAKERVQKRFVTSNAYFVVDKLVSKAVNQLQRGLDQVDNMFDSIPGVSTIIAFAKVFVGIALGYVDECCLGYTFYHEDQEVFKSAADGVVTYFQNWKSVLKNAAILSLTVIVSVTVTTLIIFTIVGGVFALLGWNGFIAFILSLFIAMIIKIAFIDSYIMISMMVKYLEVAPQTEISVDLYGKLCKLSEQFKELFNKGNTRDKVA